MEKVNNKKIWPIVLLMLVLGIALGFGGSYFYFNNLSKDKKCSDVEVNDKKETPNKKTDTNKDEDNSTLENNNSGSTTNTNENASKNTVTKPLCHGTYHANGYTYVLNDDYTYVAGKSLEGEQGTFKIENGKISFTHRIPYAPAEAGNQTDTYSIDDTCSTIYYLENNNLVHLAN